MLCDPRMRAFPKLDSGRRSSTFSTVGGGGGRGSRVLLPEVVNHFTTHLFLEGEQYQSRRLPRQPRSLFQTLSSLRRFPWTTAGPPLYIVALSYDYLLLADGKRQNCRLLLH